MRIRTIKPEFFRSEKIADLDPLVRLAFIGLWGLCDRDGRLEDRPKRIKIEVLPYDDVDMDTILQTLHHKGFIHRYTAEGNDLIWVHGFKEHQRIGGKEAETPSKYPEYVPSEAIGKQQGSTGEALGIAGKEGKGKEWKGKEGNPPVPPWWDSSEDGLAQELCRTVYESDAAERVRVCTESNMLRMLGRVRQYAPDDDAVRLLGSSVVEYLANKPKQKILDLPATIENWAKRRESEWRKARYFRDKDQQAVPKPPEETTKLIVIDGKVVVAK